MSEAMVQMTGGPTTAPMMGRAGQFLALVLSVLVLSVSALAKYPRGKG